MKVRIDDVIVDKRFRKDLGALDGLMENIRVLGLRTGPNQSLMLLYKATYCSRGKSKGGGASLLPLN